MCDQAICQTVATSPLISKVTDVFKVFHSVFNLYQPQEVFLSFNGGKDCTVLLDLLNLYQKSHLMTEIVRVVYIRPSNPFQEIEQFVDSCERFYNIKIDKLQGNLKTALESLCQENPQFKGVIMGSRRSDPFCENLKIMQQTDKGWPQLMRVSPLLEWSCRDIWDCILFKEIPYCLLYDEGYTSIGDIDNTRKNPHLKVIDPNTGAESYRPAFELLTDSLERAGRI